MEYEADIATNQEPTMNVMDLFAKKCGEFNNLLGGRREKTTRDVRREKQDRDVVTAKIFELFKIRPRYKFTELQAETNEPKVDNYIDWKDRFTFKIYR